MCSPPQWMSRLGLDTYLNSDFLEQRNKQLHCPESSSQSSHPVDDENRNVNTHVRHMHHACEHDFNPEDFDSTVAVKLSDPDQYVIEADGNMTPVTVVFHPRWCRACLTQRATELESNLRSRIDNYPSPESANSEEEAIKLRCDIAYLAGILGGRTHALFTPLEDNERLDITDALGESQDLAAILDRLSLERSQPVDVTEEMISRLENLEIAYDELVYEMEMIVKLWQEEAKGFDDGRAIQAAAERLAIDQADLDLKEQYLKMALC